MEYRGAETRWGLLYARTKRSMRINVCGTEIDRYTFKEVVTKITDRAASGGEPQYVVTPNAQHILLLRQDPYLRKIYRDAFLVIPDGFSVICASWLLKPPLPERVTGVDVFEQLCEIAPQKGLRIFLLGGRPGAADLTAQILKDRYPGIEIVGTDCPPLGFEKDPKQNERISATIKAAAPDILLVGLGAPKQEYWIYEHYQSLGVPISLGIGGSFELISGMVKRAPQWMQDYGLEWLFRLSMEPRRLWRRYLIGNPHFIWLVLQQRLGLLRDP